MANRTSTTSTRSSSKPASPVPSGHRANSIHSASSGHSTLRDEPSGSDSKRSSKRASTMAELMARAGSQVKPLQKGDVVYGTIKKLTPSEILLDIGAKGDALAIEYDKKNLENLLALLNVGERVKAVIISPESEEGFPVVSLRRALDELIFSQYEKIFKNSQTFEALVSEPTRGGFFVESEFGVRGFLPNSQVLPASLKLPPRLGEAGQRGEDEENIVGRRISVKIIEFDRAKKRLILSQKATAYATNLDEIKKLSPIGSEISGTITNITPYGLYFTFEPRPSLLVEGFVHISQVSHDRVANIYDMFKKGEKIQVKILEVDHENRRVNASLKSLAKDPFEDVQERFQKEQKIQAVVKEIRNRGVILEIEPNIAGFISRDKIPADLSYKMGENLEVEVSDFDMKRRVIIVSPVLKAKPIGYR